MRRNPLITRTLYYSKDMESFATGLKRIYTACEKAGCRVEFKQQPYGFVVIFYRQDKYNMGKNIYVNTYDDKQNKVLGYCVEAKSKREIAEYLGYRTEKSVTDIIKPLIEDGVLEMTIPDKPKSINQKYITKL